MVNPPRFPLHVPNESIADKHPFNIQIFCRELRFCCQRILCINCGVQDQVRYTVSWLYWPVDTLWRQISHLPAPPPNRLFVNLPVSGRHMTSVFQGLSLSRSIGRVGENPWNEVDHKYTVRFYNIFFVYTVVQTSSFFLEKKSSRRVSSAISAYWNPRAQLFEGRLVLNPGFSFLCSKAFSRIIFSVVFRAFNHQLGDKKNQNWNAF